MTINSIKEKATKFWSKHKYKIIGAGCLALGGAVCYKYGISISKSSDSDMIDVSIPNNFIPTTEIWVENGSHKAILTSIKSEELGEIGKSLVDYGFDPEKMIGIVAEEIV